MTQLRAGYPLYLQVKTWLLERIESGEWTEGSLIPSESELIATHKVSRTTIRQALQDLVASGYLVRKQGRGTFVAKREQLFTSSPLYGFREELELYGRLANICKLTIQIEPASPDVALHLRILAGADVVKISRTICEEGQPIMADISYLPEAIQPLIDENSLRNASIYSVLESHGISIAAGEQMISAVNADEATASMINCQPGEAVLYVERVTRDKNGQPIEYSIAKYRPKFYEYRVRLTRKLEKEDANE